MSSVPFTFRIDPEMKANLEAAARDSDRTPGYLVKKAISTFLQAREEKRHAIDTAIKEANKGVFVSSEAMHKWMEAMENGENSPRPKPDVFLK